MDNLELYNRIYNKLVDIEKLLLQKDKPFMNIDEASEYLQLSKQTLYAYTSKNVIPYYKMQGRRVYFKKEELDNFVLDKNSRLSSQEEIESKAATYMVTKRI
jgi:excisionase family DNA binding protein